jgi:hypothetical protein
MGGILVGIRTEVMVVGAIVTKVTATRFIQVIVTTRGLLLPRPTVGQIWLMIVTKRRVKASRSTTPMRLPFTLHWPCLGTLFNPMFGSRAWSANCLTGIHSRIGRIGQPLMVKRIS